MMVQSNLYRLFVVLMKARVCSMCASTSPSNEPSTDVTTTTAATVTTTTVLTTTTAALTTTTTAALACATCTLGDITLTPGTVTPTGTGPTIGADGCADLTVTCSNPGGTAFMQFNVDEGGPLQPIGETVSAMLDCVNGQWVYAPAGQVSRVITEVNCVAT